MLGWLFPTHSVCVWHRSRFPELCEGGLIHPSLQFYTSPHRSPQSGDHPGQPMNDPVRHTSKKAVTEAVWGCGAVPLDCAPQSRGRPRREAPLQGLARFRWASCYNGISEYPSAIFMTPFTGTRARSLYALHTPRHGPLLPFILCSSLSFFQIMSG